MTVAYFLVYSGLQEMLALLQAVSMLTLQLLIFYSDTQFAFVFKEEII